jgi:hypothetical protein
MRIHEVALSWFIYYNRLMMHGNTNVKNLKCVCFLFVTEHCHFKNTVSLPCMTLFDRVLYCRTYQVLSCDNFVSVIETDGQ